MPVNIYRKDTLEPLAWLCDGNWRLPDQVEALESWLSENGRKIKKGNYIADIGFCPREDASGGGAALSPEMMQAMAKIGMWLFLSEYPADEPFPRRI